jgi:hypothetical protein
LPSSPQQPWKSAEYYRCNWIYGERHARPQAGGKAAGGSWFPELRDTHAEIASLNELSGHADQRELLHWFEPLVTGLRIVFLVHGDPQQAGRSPDCFVPPMAWK